MILASRSDNTIKCYVNAYQRYKKWTARYPQTTAFPANPKSVTLYMLSLGQAGKSQASINMAHAGISWIHRTGGHPDPTMDNVYLTVYKGVKRSNATQVAHKRLVTAQIIRDIRQSMIQEDNPIPLGDYRLLLFIILAYSGFLRFHEACHIRRPHVHDHRTHLDFLIPTSKTDRMREGKHVIIAATGTDLCPVTCLHAYCEWAGIADMDDVFIFRNVFHDTSVELTTGILKTGRISNVF